MSGHLSGDVVGGVNPRKAGTTVEFETLHTMSEEHIGWFRAGSALNIIRARAAG